MTLMDCLSNSSDDFENNGTLIFAHVLYRHGDRTPELSNFPTDSNPVDWNMEVMTLTEAGRKQHYDLGQWLGERYKNKLISNKYDPMEVHIQSSNFSRTILSAAANLEALFPEVDSETFEKSIKVVDLNADYIIAPMMNNCPNYFKAFHAYTASPGYQQYDNKTLKLYDDLIQFTGLIDIKKHYALFIDVFDVIMVKTLHNITLPEWTRKFYPDNPLFIEAVKHSYRFPCATTNMAKYNGGYLLKDILDRSTIKFENLLRPNRNLWIYSTHDSVLLRLLRALEMFDDEFINFAACLIVELRLHNNVPHVEIFYRNHPTELVQLEIPNCGQSCPLAKMYQLYEHVLPSYPFEEECVLST